MGGLSRDVIERAFSAPVAFRPTGWPDGEPDAQREPTAAEAKARLLAALDDGPKTSAEEQGRFIGADGVPVVSVVVARSVPFAKALLHEWSLVDGKDRDWMIKFKALVIPAATYDAILPAVRRRLRPGGLDE